jgi:Rrf2 family protein
MDLALTRRGDYAVRAALCLARRADGGYVKIREVAAAMALPPSYTPQVLRLLAAAGLAEARAGRGGGYRLTRPPGEVALLEVVEAAEGQRPDRGHPLGGRRGPQQGGREVLAPGHDGVGGRPSRTRCRASQPPPATRSPMARTTPPAAR